MAPCHVQLMFGINYGNSYGGRLNVWNSYQAQPSYNYNPFSSWTNNFTNTGSTQPYGYGSYQYNLDRFDSGGVGNSQAGNQVNANQESDYMRRLKVLQALGPGAAARIPNWQTMPFNDFLLAAARLKGIKPGNQTNTNPKGNLEYLPLNVTARAYYDESQQLQQVTSVNVWEMNTGVTENTYNNYGSKELYARFGNAVKGRTYRIEVTWSDGRRFQIEGINATGNVVVDRPNRY